VHKIIAFFIIQYRTNGHRILKSAPTVTLSFVANSLVQMSSVGRSVGTGLKKLYGSLRVNGRPSRSKSVSNLQDLFNPPTQEELKQAAEEQEKEVEIDDAEKENILRKSMELSALRRKSLDLSRVTERSSSGALDKSISYASPSFVQSRTKFLLGRYLKSLDRLEHLNEARGVVLQEVSLAD
jgi:hypothetical protein